MRFPPPVWLCFLFLVLVSHSPAEHIGIYQHGTIVRMHMGDCLPDHSIMNALAGSPRPQAAEVCPEYTLLGDKVVYVIVGRPSKDVLPLAQEVGFRIRKNEIGIRVDDANHETRFRVREMILRADWDQMTREGLQVRRRYSMPVLQDQ